MTTLLSDFGLQDASVAIAKGILMQHSPTGQIIDISHEVQPFHLGQAAYLLGAAYKNFPAGTCHLLLFDVFSEPEIKLILSEYEGQYFLSADNGLLTAALGQVPDNTWLCYELNRSDTFNDWLHAAGKVINRLSSQQPKELGLQAYTLKNKPKNTQPASEDGGLKCEVIHIDHFENVVINFTREQLASLGEGKMFRMQFVGVEEINEISNNYSDVRPGYKLCRFNSSGYLELCINRGKAASLFGLRLGGKFNDIKIFFE